MIASFLGITFFHLVITPGTMHNNNNNNNNNNNE